MPEYAMLVSLLLALSLVLQEAPAKTGPANTGTISGELAPVSGKAVTRPMRVVMIPGDFGNVYDAEALKLLDENWERYKPALAQQKELFLPISQMAQREALEFVLDVMKQNGVDIGKMTGNTSSSGQFEFRNLPQGEYKIVAYGALGTSDVVWQGWVNLNAAGPIPVLLKSTLP